MGRKDKSNQATLLKRIQHRTENMKISFKIAIIYLILIIMSTIFSSLLFNEIYLNMTRNKVSDVSIQTLQSIQANVDLLVDNVDNYSKMILSDSNLQILLRNGNVYGDLYIQSQVGSYLYKLLQSIPSISSVYICDNSDHIYSVGTDDLPNILPKDIKEAYWYEQVVEKKGAYLLARKGGGIGSKESEKNYISLIRLIRDTENTHNLGVLIINIPEKAFQQAFANISGDLETYIAILDENNQSIITQSEADTSMGQSEMKNKVITTIAENTEDFVDEKFNTMEKQIGNTKYLVSYLLEEKYNWKFIRMMPFSNISEENTAMGVIGFIVIMCNGFFIFFSTVGISRIITVPINHLLNSMKDIENGVFHKVHIKTHSLEFRQLCKGYNIMISEIEKLLANTIEKQKLIRKAELNTLQAQIKPHFLYNTLDSINSLALSGKNEEVCELVDALGSFYRACVSKGKEFISVREEINMIKNYLKIQKVRYCDLFTVNYIIDENTLSFQIPKLILQPLVENAMYHGIRAKGEKGTITVGAELVKDVVNLWIEDDGIGMSKEQIQDIFKSEIGVTNRSFGLKGTLERTEIFSGTETAFKIESQLGIGTKITLYLSASTREEL